MPIIAQDRSGPEAPAPAEGGPIPEAVEDAPVADVPQPVMEEDAGEELLPPVQGDEVPADEIPLIEENELTDPNPVPVPTKDSPVTRDSGAANFVAVNLSGITVYRDERTSLKQAPKAPPNAGVGVKLLEGLTTPKPEALRQTLEKNYLSRNAPASFRDLEGIVEEILEHYRTHNRPMTHVYIPQQPYGPIIRFAVIEGVVGDVRLLTEAGVRNKNPDELDGFEKPFRERIESGGPWWKSWYRDPYQSDDLARNLGPRLDAVRGRVVDTEELKVQLAAINRSPWARLNRPVEHPFREVAMRFSPPENHILGQTDLIFEFGDSRPLKFFAGYENNLTELLGDDRLFVGAAWYDAFLLGRDHQLGLQVFSAFDPGDLLGVSGNYLIPWRGGSQFTELYAAYAESSADILIAGVPSEIGGTNLILGGRHYIELPELLGATDFSQPLPEKDRFRPWAHHKREALGLHHEVGMGLDYKATDNDIAFGGISAAQNPADIFQFVLEYNARQTDPVGETNLSLQMYYSPGDITENNDSESYAPLRFNSSASYFYTRLRLDRELDLPYMMMARAVVTGQWSDGNLLASEQLGVGGYSSVRGYPERVHRGDVGYVTNLELYSPEFRPAQDWFKQGMEDRLRFLAFFDLGYGASVDENPADPLDDDSTLMSVGVGLRYEFRNDLRFRLDYGVQLKDTIPSVVNDSSGAFHIGLAWTF